MGDKGVGVAGHIAGVGVDDLIVVAAGRGEVLGNLGLCVGNALTQNLIDSKSNIVGILNDGGIVVENGLTRITAADQAAENQRGQHEDKQHREHEQDRSRRKELASVPARSQGQPCGGSIGSAHRRAFGRCCDGLAGLDCSMNGLRSAGRLGQAAFFLVVQTWIPPCEWMDFLYNEGQGAKSSRLKIF